MAAMALTILVAGAIPTAAAGAPSPFFCSGGTIPAGTYSVIYVNGFCEVNEGSVTTTGDLIVQPNAALIAAFSGSILNVGGNLLVSRNAILVLGCGGADFGCFDGPGSAHQTVTRGLTSNGATMVLVHNVSVGGSVIQTGGGGGLTCDNAPLGPDGPPAYSTYEDASVGGSLTISGVQTCWMAVIRTTVTGNLTYSSNMTADPDGNEIVTNVVHQNLVCSGNSPAPQVGDSEGSPNTVFGVATGQCASLAGGGGPPK